MSVLLCDSNCELWYSRAKELNIDYISMPYFDGEKEYGYDLGKNTDFTSFFNKMRSGVMVKTMALNPDDYIKILTPYFERGEDVLYISFSHAMSGTFAQLDKALAQLKTVYPDRKCTVFNTNSISLGAGIQVEAAAQLKQNGASDDEIISFLNDFTNKVSVYFVVDDLVYLKRGGRVSSFSAAAASILNIKPMLTFDEKGGLSVISKIKGRKKSIHTLADKVVNELTDTRYPVYILDADCKDDGDAVAALVKENIAGVNIIRQPVGPVIGAHCGPGTVGVIFISDRRPIPLRK